MARMVRNVLFGLLFCFATAVALPQTIPSISGLPGTLTWQNPPRSWRMDKANVLTISAEAKTDWFVNPFDGTVAKNAPILLFTPASDYVLGAQVTLKFVTKWDAGALMLWGDDHHWAKLSFELSPGKKPHSLRWSHEASRTTAIPAKCAEIPSICGLQRTVRRMFSTFRQADTIGKFSALLAWIQSFLSASVLRRSLRQAPVPS